MDPEARKEAYLELVLHRIAKKRFARPQIGTRGGPRKGPSFLKAKSTGLAQEMDRASKFGIDKEAFVSFLKNHSWAHVDLVENQTAENTMDMVENRMADDTLDSEPSATETNAVETS